MLGIISVVARRLMVSSCEYYWRHVDGGGLMGLINTLFFELSIIEKGTVGCPTPLQTQILNSPIMSKIEYPTSASKPCHHSLSWGTMHPVAQVDNVAQNNVYTMMTFRRRNSIARHIPFSSIKHNQAVHVAEVAGLLFYVRVEAKDS